MSKAIYAFSGDPITYGHIDIIARAARVFDEVLVGIGVNPAKSCMFSINERREMAGKALRKFPNVSIVAFQGLLVDYAYENNVDVIIKGVRNAADVDYEKNLHQIGESQKLGVDTHILFAKPELAHISSTAVKAVQKEQGFIHEYVPLHVKQMLEARMSGQYIIGITGEICSGKSYVCERFEAFGKKHDLPVANIELDHIGHQILGELSEPKYLAIRELIIRAFGPEVEHSDGSINRKALGEIVFNDLQELKKLNGIMSTPLMVRLRRALYGKQGLILLNAALIAEAEMMQLCNNHVVLIHVDTASQIRRLLARNLTEEQIERRLASQYNFEQKRARITEAINRADHGKLWLLDNSDNRPETELVEIFEDIIGVLQINRK